MSQALQSPWAQSVFDAQLPLQHLTAPAPWAGHIPFAFWSVQTLRPRVFVELGSFSGVSYFAFCQAIEAADLDTQAHAIDTWAGDPHAGYYGEDVYRAFISRQAEYAAFSTAHRKTFDEALDGFAEQTIDLLHIDGLHTYEAVQHDFTTWLPKLTDDAVVLFHDIREYSGDFGVHQFWDELMTRYPGLAFEHSHGLGVLCLSPVGLDRFQSKGVDITDAVCAEHLKTVFSFLGRHHELQAELLQTKASVRDYEARESHHRAVAQALTEVERLRDQLQKEIYQLKRWSVLPVLRQLKRALGLGTNIATHQGPRLLARCGRFLKYVIARTLNATRYMLRGDWSGLLSRFEQVRRDGLQQAPRDVKTIGLLSVPHTLSVARAFQEALTKLGFEVSQPVTGYQKGLEDLWFVFGAQALKHLPPAGRRVIVQLEQTSSDRWFTKRYMRVLKQSVAVCDFSQKNLAGLRQFGIIFPHVFLTRLAGFTPPIADQPPKDIDVLFYGDPFCDRRQHILARLQSEFHVEIVTNTFGEAMHAFIQRAKVVVNIHYYPDANLETTRLYECLSLGAQVVSETSPDYEDYPELHKCVVFVPSGDTDALVQAVRDSLQNQSNKTKEYTTLIQSAQGELRWDLARLFQGIGVREARISEQLTFQLVSNRVVLSLPETPDRYHRALSEFPPEFQVLTGLRASPGWRGCGYSYQAIAVSALTADFERLWIVEDDAQLPPHTDESLAQIEEFLDGYADWDVFCGLISRFEQPPQILDVIEDGDVTFVVLDQMMSMVANCYSRHALQHLAAWDDEHVDSDENTIDVHLNRHCRRVVTTIPALFGHESSLASTLWGIGNEGYEPVIDSAQEALNKAVSEFLAQRDAKKVIR